MTLTAESLREVLDYDPETGVFTWTVDVGQRGKRGTIAGSISVTGYPTIQLFRKKYRSSRLAWIYAHGRWPENYIDHIDGDKMNTRLENLREATHAENAQNQRKAHSHSKTGILGVCKNNKKWKARIRINKVEVYIGTFATQEEAGAAYVAYKRLHHPMCTI